jgi:roadblock/LC7 domain-containing protein
MAVADRHLALSRLDPVFLGSAKAAATGAVKTTNSIATGFNNTLAIGTNVDVPRFLSYLISAAAGTYVKDGTIVVYGSDIRGSAQTETIAMSLVNAAQSDGVRGSKAFAQLATNFSLSSYQLTSAHTGSTNSVTIAIGLANILGFPNSIKNASAVPYASIGTLNQAASFTVIPGNVPFAGISFSNALATNTPAQALVFHSR